MLETYFYIGHCVGAVKNSFDWQQSEFMCWNLNCSLPCSPSRMVVLHGSGADAAIGDTNLRMLLLLRLFVLLLLLYEARIFQWDARPGKPKNGRFASRNSPKWSTFTFLSSGVLARRNHKNRRFSQHFGDGLGTVLESTVSNTELSEVFAALTEFSVSSSQRIICTEFFAELTEFAPKLSEAQSFLNTLETVFRPLPKIGGVVNSPTSRIFRHTNIALWNPYFCSVKTWIGNRHQKWTYL